MGFEKEIKEQAAIASKRICCICKKFCGRNMEFNHIVPRSQGGEDTFENCIPVCFDCHSDVGHYNIKHPKGNKYSQQELTIYRDEHYQKVKEGYYDNVKYDDYDEEDIRIIKSIKGVLIELEIIDDIEKNSFDIGFDNRIFNNVDYFHEFINKRKNTPSNELYKDNILKLDSLLLELTEYLISNAHLTANPEMSLLNESVRYNDDIKAYLKGLVSEIVSCYNDLFV